MALPKSTKIPVKLSVPVNSVWRPVSAASSRIPRSARPVGLRGSPSSPSTSRPIPRHRLLAIGLHGCGASEVLRLTPPGRGCPDGARPFPTEKHLLAAFCARVRELDPDVLTGWNVVDFDLTVLDRIAGPNGVPLELGRGPGTLHLRAQGSPRGARQATIPAASSSTGSTSCAAPSSGWTTTAWTPAPPPRSRRLLDRRLRPSLPRSARTAGDRGPQRPRGSRDRGASGRRPRPRAPSRPLHERRRAGLRESLPEPHPHLRDRPSEPRPARGRPGGWTSVGRLRGRTKRRRTCGSRPG